MSAVVRERKSSASEAVFKIIVIGDSGSGKSSLLTRYVKDQFAAEYKVTIGKSEYTQAWSLWLKQSKLMRTTELNCKFGIRQGKRTFKAS